MNGSAEADGTNPTPWAYSALRIRAGSRFTMRLAGRWLASDAHARRRQFQRAVRRSLLRGQSPPLSEGSSTLSSACSGPPA
jgi:hypothetical protein